MSRRESPNEPLPSYVRLRTAPEMTKVAGKLAFVKKAIKEIGMIENELTLHSQVAEDDLKMAMNDTIEMANLIMTKSNEAIQILKKVSQKVKAYQGKLEDAVG